MSHSIFISYASADFRKAQEICAFLSASGWNHWMAPDSISPGEQYAIAISRGIKNCSKFLLVFSQSSDASNAVMNEIELASKHKKEVVTVRIEDAEPSNLEYYVATSHWVDYFKPDGQIRLRRAFPIPIPIPVPLVPLPFAVGGDVILSPTGTPFEWRGHRQSGVGLRSICFATHSLGWAVGNGGTILRTEDGGVNWQQSPSPTQNNLRAVTCPTTNACWAVGEHGEMIHTNDGQNWERYIPDTKKDLLAIAFADSNSGWAVGSSGIVLHTDDGGVSWHKQKIVTILNLVSVAANSTQSCWLLDSWGGRWHSRDGGKNWNLPIPARPAFALTHHSGKSLWAVGSQIIFSNDGGENWKAPESSHQEGLTLRSVAFSDAKSGWAVGDKGLILHTADGGATWTREASGVITNLLAVAIRPTPSI